MSAMTAASPVPEALGSASQLDGIVHVLMCGSVDDGKSTLIGRLLWDTSNLYDDQREAIIAHGLQAVGGKHYDYSRLVDGLIAEHEQGITIDIAWRYVDADARRYVIIDSPGHEQYTRNMASGASHADVAVLLVDARHGLKQQSRRHLALLDLFGVKRVILAVNKMDLVDWSEDRFREISADFQAMIEICHFDSAEAIPVQAVGGENMTSISGMMPWYEGPTLLGQLSATPASGGVSSKAFRMPVQCVLRDGQDYRGLAGSISSGSVRVGDEFVDVGTGQRGQVARIAMMDGDLDVASQGRAVTIIPDVDLDISRGAVIGLASQPPSLVQGFDGRIIWLSETPFDAGAGYLLRTATGLVPVSQLAISSLLDLGNLTEQEADGCAVNDIAAVSIELSQAVALDSFAEHPATGSFVLVEAAGGNTVAGGVIVETRVQRVPSDVSAFVLSWDMLAGGLCSDLDNTELGQVEFKRRMDEVAYLLTAAGVSLDLAQSSQHKLGSGGAVSI